MTIIAYFDVYPGIKPEQVCINTTPLREKFTGNTRYKVEIHIEDPAKPDREVAPENLKVSEQI